jgi:hypothetical protein
MIFCESSLLVGFFLLVDFLVVDDDAFGFSSISDILG